MKPLRVALLTSDAREMLQQYSTLQPIFGTALKALFQGFARRPELELHVLSCVQQRVAAPEKLAANIWFHSIVVPKVGWLRTGYAGCIGAVRARLRAIGPALVHGQGSERECAMCAVWSGYPNVLTMHGLMGEMKRSVKARPGSFLWCAAVLEKHAIKRTGGVLCNSSYTAAYIRRLTPRTWNVANAVREEFFSTPSARRESPPTLLNVGHISSNKRQTELLELAGRLHARGFRFRIIFLGHADPKDSYVADFLERCRLAASQGYAGYEGLKLDQELIDCLDRASALVHFPKVETFGLAVAEGLARGLKLFGNRCGGVVDVAGDAEGAELVDLDDLPALESRLARWLEAGAPMPADAGAGVRRRYLPETIAGQHLEIYQEVLAKGTSKAA